MKPTQHLVKSGHFRVELNGRALDVVEYAGRWYVNQFPDAPVDCGSSQSEAAFAAVAILEAEGTMEIAA